MTPDYDALTADGYVDVTVKAGHVCGLLRMMYTWGLFVGLDKHGYHHRYCYHTYVEAAGALRDWNGEGDPLGYIVRKGR